MGRKLALYTFGMFIEPADHPNNVGFLERNDPILAAIKHAPGFLGRSGYDGDPGPESWGDEVYPHFYVERGDGWSPATLSLWQDLESPMAFSYFGLHAEALRHGRDWFEKPTWPPLVTWWVDDTVIPMWRDGVERHEYLHDHGPTPHAFSFKQPYDSKGDCTEIDRVRMKELAASLKF